MADYVVTPANVFRSPQGLTKDAIAAEDINAGDVLYRLADNTVGLYVADGDTPKNVIEGVALNTAFIGQPVRYCYDDPAFDPGTSVVEGATIIGSKTPGKMCPDADKFQRWAVNEVGHGNGNNKITLKKINTGDFVPFGPMYVQFHANVHDATDVSQFINLYNEFGSLGYLMTIARDSVNSRCHFYTDGGGDGPQNVYSANGTFAINTDYVIEFTVTFEDITPHVLSRATIIPKFNGVALTAMTMQVLYVVNTPPIRNPFVLRFGGLVNSSGTMNHTLDGLKIGTTGLGTSDVFLADFAGLTVVPPFDSEVNAGFLDASSGALVVTDPGSSGQAYAQLNILNF